MFSGSAVNCSKSIFKFVDNQKDGMFAYTQRLQWSNGSGSDLVAMLNAYTFWSKMHREKSFGNANDRENVILAEQEWASRHCLDVAALYECRDHIEEIKECVKRIGFKVQTEMNHDGWTNNQKITILKVVIAGAFLPNLFGRSTPHHDDSERDMYSVIGGRDLQNTVFFSGFDRQYLRQLYVRPITQLFVASGVILADELDNIHVSFDEGSQKVFVTFSRDDSGDQLGAYGVAKMPGSILPVVYKSIQMRNLHMSTQIGVIGYDRQTQCGDTIKFSYRTFRICRSTERALQVALSRGLQYDIDKCYVSWSSLDIARKICLPTRMENAVDGFITYV